MPAKKNHFERSGLSKNPEKLAAMVKAGVETAEPKLAIRDPFIFEFLGLRAKDAVEESDLEAALMANLREFLLELGHGFCLEAQQKSIFIGKTRGFVDLVFYHRVLKCHMLVELKVDKFTHEHIGQLNTYATWYRKHMMAAATSRPWGSFFAPTKTTPCRIRHGEHGQPSFRLQIPARTSEQRGPSAVLGDEAEGSERDAQNIPQYVVMSPICCETFIHPQSYE